MRPLTKDQLREYKHTLTFLKHQARTQLPSSPAVASSSDWWWSNIGQDARSTATVSDALTAAAAAAAVLEPQHPARNAWRWPRDRPADAVRQAVYGYTPSEGLASDSDEEEEDQDTVSVDDMEIDTTEEDIDEYDGDNDDDGDNDGDGDDDGDEALPDVPVHLDTASSQRNLQAVLPDYLRPLFEELEHTAKHKIHEQSSNVDGVPASAAAVSALSADVATKCTDAALELLRCMDAMSGRIRANYMWTTKQLTWESVLSCAKMSNAFPPSVLDAVEQKMRAQFRVRVARVAESRMATMARMLDAVAELCGIKVDDAIDSDGPDSDAQEDREAKQEGNDVKIETEPGDVTLQDIAELAVTEEQEKKDPPKSKSRKPKMSRQERIELLKEAAEQIDAFVDPSCTAKQSARLLRDFERRLRVADLQPLRAATPLYEHLEAFFYQHFRMAQNYLPVLGHFGTFSTLFAAIEMLPKRSPRSEFAASEHFAQQPTVHDLDKVEYLHPASRRCAPVLPAYPAMMYLPRVPRGVLIPDRVRSARRGQHRCAWCGLTSARPGDVGPSGHCNLCLRCAQRARMVARNEREYNNSRREWSQRQLTRLVRHRKPGESYTHAIIRNLSRYRSSTRKNRFHNGDREGVGKLIHYQPVDSLDYLAWRKRCAWCRTREEPIAHVGPDGSNTLCSTCHNVFALRRSREFSIAWAIASATTETATSSRPRVDNPNNSDDGESSDENYVTVAESE
ncbi:hypothetical protein RI367_000782 [Sorochytrium milnesiophthora]